MLKPTRFDQSARLLNSSLSSSASIWTDSPFGSLRASPGDSRSSALQIKKDSFDRKDRVGRDEDDDFYRFDLSKTRDIKITVQNREGIFGPDLKFRLLRSNGSQIKSREVQQTQDESISRELKKGTYYIKVESDGQSVPYRLRYKSSEP
ncbi:MAG: PPC domain-containing protein [Pegethrix bostrychoides GSE-TBD4-15B]|jgi:hypothetical protein|uniref:PPC domain-containing protein n=1 Tax=Pegethrix bostrychoides GSE-TBD4-15B TaxID=2839662 RepID=A0A951U6H2_9CYAN|nr:PPC domain-containing protein [Pegethrix bostrychoides GSE-TBD4-15B]